MLSVQEFFTTLSSNMLQVAVFILNHSTLWKSQAIDQEQKKHKR